MTFQTAIDVLNMRGAALFATTPPADARIIAD